MAKRYSYETQFVGNQNRRYKCWIERVFDEGQNKPRFVKRRILIKINGRECDRLGNFKKDKR